MLKGILIDCPRNLIENWDDRLERRGMRVSLKPPPSKEDLNAMGGVCYREGRVELDNTTIDIRACLIPSSRHQWAGKYILLLTYWSKQQKQLASRIASIFVELGGSIIEVKRGKQTGEEK